jgi:lipopolysaccharide export system protein LptA
MKFIEMYRSYRLFKCFLALCLAAWASISAAQGTVYRCKGNEYVANVKDSKNGECKILEGGNVTVVQGTRVGGAEPVRVASVSPKASTSSSSSPRILESELKKAEAKQAELLKEYNNGEPDRNALDIKNPQRYVDRVAELKANIARNDSDIAGIKRELGRNQGSTARAN